MPDIGPKAPSRNDLQPETLSPPKFIIDDTMLYKFNMMSTEYAAETEIFNLLKRTGLGWVSLGG
jgi:hypothetical protein